MGGSKRGREGGRPGTKVSLKPELGGISLPPAGECEPQAWVVEADPR